MIDQPQWIYIDNILLIIQLCIIFYYAIYSQKTNGLFNSIIISFALYLFITPLGLIPVGLLPDLVYNESLLRYASWHFKLIAGISFNDFLLITLTILLLLKLLSQRFINKGIFLLIVFLLLLFSLGVISVLQSPYTPYFKNFLNSFRSLLLIIPGLIVGYSISRKRNSYEWIIDFLWSIAFLSLISIFSMSLLTEKYRATRYWSSAILQSQSSVFPFIFLTFIILFKNKLARKLSLIKKIIIVGSGLFIAGSGYKGIIFMFILFVILWLDLHTLKIHFLIFQNKIILTSFLLGIIFLSLSIVIFNYYSFRINALDTRLFQLKNSLTTLTNCGPNGLLFGIGWKQWYTIYYPFPTDDLGAWTPEEIQNNTAKYAIQIPPFSIIRSIGIVGFFLLFAVLFKSFEKIKRNVLNASLGKTFLFFITFMLFPVFFTFPDILPEDCLIISLLLSGFLYPIKQIHDIENE